MTAILPPGSAWSAWAASFTRSTRDCSTTSSPISSITPRTGCSSTTRRSQPLVERLKPQLADDRALHLLRRRVRRLARGRGRRLSLVRRRRARAVRPLLHQRHDRQPQGRALRASLDRAPRDVDHRAGHLRSVGALGHAAGRADVPRQQLVHSLCGGDRRVQAGDLRATISPSASASCSTRRASPIRRACRPSG